MLKLFEDYPQLYKPLVLNMCRRLRITLSLIQDAVFLELPIRLARRLLTLAEISGEPCDQGITFKHRLSQEELSQMLCVSRQSINKIMKEWQANGWIKVQYGNTVLADPTALEAFVKQATNEAFLNSGSEF